MQRLEQKLPEYLDAALRKVRNRADQPRSAVHGPQFIAGLRCAANMIEEAGRRAAILARQPEAVDLSKMLGSPAYPDARTDPFNALMGKQPEAACAVDDDWRWKYEDRRALVSHWHAEAVRLGYDGVADLLACVEKGEPPIHLAEVMARAGVSAPPDKYAELLYAVSRKYPGESRHETALRYIRQAENQDNSPAAATPPGDDAAGGA